MRSRVRENGNHSDCLQAVWVGDGLYFRRNYLHDNRCQGFFVKDQASTVSNVVAEDNLFLRNDAPCATAGCGQPSVFQLFGPMTGLVIRRNTIWTPGGGSPITLRDGGWGSVLVDSNVMYRPWSDTSAPFGAAYTAINNIAGTAPEAPGRASGITVVALLPEHRHRRLPHHTAAASTGRPPTNPYGPDGSDPGGGGGGGGGGGAPPPDNTAPNTTILRASGPTNDAADLRVRRRRLRGELHVPRGQRRLGRMHEPVDDIDAG